MAPPMSTSAITRYRPVVLFVTGAAAALTAYLIYTSTQTAAGGNLHRSNAVRRPRRHRQGQERELDEDQLRRSLETNDSIHIRAEAFGEPWDVGPNSIPNVQELLAAARRHGMNPSVQEVRSRVEFIQRVFLESFLQREYPSRLPSPMEMRVLVSHFHERGIRPDIFSRAWSSLSHDEPQVDGTEERDDASVAGTDMSWDPNGPSSTVRGVNRDDQTLQRLLYHIAEDRANQEGIIHHGVTCDGCGEKPIRGIRWRCANCADFDLCSGCEATNSHIKSHIFYKIKVPAPHLASPKNPQPSPYPGNPQMMQNNIPQPLKKSMVELTKMEPEEIEGLWHQFTCLAATPWQDDPQDVHWAINRRAFDKAFIPHYTHTHTAPNLVYDRVFSLFDTDENGLIGFREFLEGLNAMHSRDIREKLQLVFKGYDIDNDGYITRKDVLRIFRASYLIEREATKDHLAARFEELSVAGALDTIRSSQPLGSAFMSSTNLHSVRSRQLHKQIDRFGDLRSGDDDVIAESTEDVADRSYIIANYATEDSPEERSDRVRDRWRRRQFYVDEEEGFTADEVPELDDVAEEHEDNGHHAQNGVIDPPVHETQSVTRGSRSSSRVRFQDDVDFEIRSNASTSSRPIGERWGGYEIPEAEKDIGRDVLYQLTQQGFNELLDPLFKMKETLALAVYQSTAARKEFHSKRKATSSGGTHVESPPPEAMFTRPDRIIKIALALGLEQFKSRFRQSLNARLYPPQYLEMYSDMSREGKEAVFERMLHLVENEEDLGLGSEPPELESFDRVVLIKAVMWRKQIIAEVRKKFVEGPHWSSRAPHSNSVLDAYIVSRPLEDLLAEAGYSVTAGDASHNADSSLSQQQSVPLPPTEPVPAIEPEPTPASTDDVDDEPSGDPTLPQFRPNSLADVRPVEERPSSPLFEPEGSINASDEPTEPSWLAVTRKYLENIAYKDFYQHFPEADSAAFAEAWNTLTTDNHYADIVACLDAMEKEMEERKGPGKISFQELFNFMHGPHGDAVAFVEAWLECVSF